MVSASPRTADHRAVADHSAVQPLLQSFTEQVTPIDPVALFAQAQRTFGGGVFWERPEEHLTLVGMGTAHQIILQGVVDGRWVLGEAQREWRRLVAGSRTSGDAGAGPLLLGGFAFDALQPQGALWSGFPAGLLTLPRLLYRQSGMHAWVTYSVVLPAGTASEQAFRTLRDMWLATRAATQRGLDEVRERDNFRKDGADSDPVAGRGGKSGSADACPDGAGVPAAVQAEAGPWRARVAEATQAIARGPLEKVVLARAIRIPRPSVVEAATALGRLRSRRAGGAIFAFAAGEHCFLGATPEQLVRLRQGRVETAALAGSRRRGATAAEDAALEQELRRSNKDRWEHAIVLRALQDGLAAGGVDLQPAPHTRVLKLATVQHLYTPLVGQVADGCSVLDLLGRLHPSPAVGGYPRPEALAWIREHEGLERGWYAGPVGWLDSGGNGDFSVAIRSALLQRDAAVLFAGCGIMADSEPEAEYAESCLKLRPMLAALQKS